MAEVIGRDGTWSLVGDVVRIVPADNRRVSKLRKALGEIAVPLAAVVGAAYEPGRKGGRLRLRLRDGADPFTQVAAGRLPEASDPYRLALEADRGGVGEYFVDELRTTLQLAQIPEGRTDRYLLPGPSVPVTASSPDGSAEFDGDRVRLTWRWGTESSKSSAGPQQFTIRELAGVDWEPAVGLDYGRLRFRLTSSAVNLPPEHDPYSLRLWGFDKENWGTLLLAAAVTARLPHPFASLPPEAPVPALAAEPSAPVGDGPDALLRQLRELGELHRDGVLTVEEFDAAKQSLLSHLRTADRDRDGA